MVRQSRARSWKVSVSICGCQRGKGSYETYITSSDVLHVGNVVVDNLQKPASLLGNNLDDVLQSLLVEGLGDTAGVDSAHGVVRATLLITLDGNLHGQTTVEHDRHQALNGHDVGQGGKGRVFTQ